jgi:hypothetical protein
MKKRMKTDVSHTTSKHSTEGEHQGENQHEHMHLNKEEQESREEYRNSNMDSGEVNKAAVDKTTAAVERTIYTTTKLGETIRNSWNAQEQSEQSGFPIDEINKGLWPAITEFLKNNNNWKLKERFINNNGLTILEKIN